MFSQTAAQPPANNSLNLPRATFLFFATKSTKSTKVGVVVESRQKFAAATFVGFVDFVASPLARSRGLGGTLFTDTKTRKNGV